MNYLQAQQLNLEYLKVYTRYQSLRFNFMYLNLKVREAERYKTFGVTRRLGILSECVENIFNIYPLNSRRNPTDKEISNLTINLQCFIFNLYGVFDDLAIIWAYESKFIEKKDNIREISFFINKEEDNKNQNNKKIKQNNKKIKQYNNLPESIRNLIENRKDWKKYHMDIRNAIAHRIPIYLAKKYDSKEDAERYNNLKTIQDEIPFSLKIVYSLDNSEDIYVFNLHKQIIIDYKTLEEFIVLFMNELKKL